MLKKIQLSFHYTPAVILSIVTAAITVATALGLDVSTNLRDAILQLAGLILAGIVIGGGVKSAGMLNAGVHPIQQAARRDAERRSAAARAALEPPPTSPNAQTLARVETNLEGAPVEQGPRASRAVIRPSVELHPHLRAGGLRANAHPILKAHGSFGGMPLGKQTAKHDPRTPLLAEFMTDAAKLGHRLPKSTHRLDPIRDMLGGDFGMMGNDGYGDCTCAALGHAIQEWTGVHFGKLVTLTTGQILDLYWKTGTQDDGRVMFEVLKYVAHNGLAGHKIGAYVGVGLRRYHHRDVRAAIDMFGGCYLGVALPETAQTQHLWDVAGDPSKPGPAQWGSWGGHAIWLTDYDQQGPTCITWAHELKMTWRFLDAYADEAYAIIAPDWLDQGKTIEGIDLAGLTEYLDRIKSGYQPPQ